MTATLTFNTDEFLGELKAQIDAIRVPVQAAMAYAFAEVTFNNFGQDGEDRPEQWPMLSKNYANMFHGGSRIPTEILTGDLQESIRNGIDISNEEYATVSTNVPYAYDQQYGNEAYNLPARPFMPITAQDEITPYTIQKCLDAAEFELQVRLN